MRKGKIFVLSLVMASLIGILLSSGVASAGGCTVNEGEDNEYCFVSASVDKNKCVDNYGGTWSNQDCAGYTDNPGGGTCCIPWVVDTDTCLCAWIDGQDKCEEFAGGIWTKCKQQTNEPCNGYCTSGGECVPEASTIALLATGLICMAGYFRLRRKEE